MDKLSELNTFRVKKSDEGFQGYRCKSGID